MIIDDLKFESFDKIPRLSRDCVITEKIDGTNVQILIVELPDDAEMPTDTPITAVVGNLLLYAGSRNRWITPGKTTDKNGFAGWVRDNANELTRLGPGRHYGEWWGLGIRRRYGIQEKRFSLFAVHRWTSAFNLADPWDAIVQGLDTRCIDVPACHVVPVLARGGFDSRIIDAALCDLRGQGSFAAPGFMNPEGIIIYHEAAKVLFKKTIEDDANGKDQQ